MGINSCGQLLIDQGNFFNTGLLDWDTTAKTANFTAVNGNGYFVNTTSAAVTVTLPAGSAGDFIGVSDYASTSNTNKITISPNGTDKINGVNDDYVMSVKGIAVSLLYVDSTRGWKAVASNSENISGGGFITATGGTITTSGDYKIHAFTGPGTFTVTCLGQPTNTVDYLVIAGGGAGGGREVAGGGGAGGYRESSGAASGCYTASPLGACVSALPVTATGYPITVGGGGSSGTYEGCNGSDSIFSTITSAGGGAGAVGTGGGGAGPGIGANGGSGGGGGRWAPGAAGSGNTPPVSPSQGNNGGTRYPFPFVDGAPLGGGGGGGAGSLGGNASSTKGGNGGCGTTTSISGSAVVRAGGGGGGTEGAPLGGGDGGPGGGGAGLTGGSPGISGNPGTVNTGGGGGGTGWGPNFSGNGGAGGSGIVMIRYKFQ